MYEECPKLAGNLNPSLGSKGSGRFESPNCRSALAQSLEIIAVSFASAGGGLYHVHQVVRWGVSRRHSTWKMWYMKDKATCVYFLCKRKGFGLDAGLDTTYVCNYIEVALIDFLSSEWWAKVQMDK